MKFLETIRRNRKRAGYVCLAAAAAVWLHTSGFQTAMDLREAWSEEHQLEADIEELKGRNAELERDIEALESNGFRIEELAREKMGLARENEFVVVVPGKQ